MSGAAAGTTPAPDRAAVSSLDAGLAVLARADWAGSQADSLMSPPGFVGSAFAPLVASVVDDCLTQVHRSRPVPADRGERTAIVLISRNGDRATADAVANALVERRKVSPLLFFQSVPNSVVGWVAGRWALGGPVVCVSPTGDPVAGGIALARLLVDDGDADEILLILVEPAYPDEGGEATALLLARAASTEPGIPVTRGAE